MQAWSLILLKDSIPQSAFHTVVLYAHTHTEACTDTQTLRHAWMHHTRVHAKLKDAE